MIVMNLSKEVFKIIYVQESLTRTKIGLDVGVILKCLVKYK